MALTLGKRLGPYEILALIGAGGMGEVYRAQDTELKREVAIKVLPEGFAHDPDRLTRFRREAQLLASLNHTNIATIHGLQESDGFHFLVLELVPGENLRERLTREGPLPVEECLAIGKQIAEALEAAHDKGVVHRDLKPANLKMTREGKIKVLDFGIAKALAGDLSTSQADSNSPTMTATPTLHGVILGTAAYMSPEQAKGKAVDGRTDIWAFGCVLFELLTGKPVFTGETVTEVLGAIHHKEPDWKSLPTDTPAGLRTLLRRCLQKDANRRYHHAADLRIEIEELQAASGPVHPAIALDVPTQVVRRWLLVGGLACLVVAAITAGLVWGLRPAPATSPQQVSRTVIPLPPDVQLTVLTHPMLELSPDGTQLAYIANGGSGPSMIYLRAINSLQARPVSGTEGAAAPFFSPDGQWIGFFAGPKLKKVSVSGGATLTLCDAPAPRGAAWGPNDTIVFNSNATGGLSYVSAAGGEPRILTKSEDNLLSHRWPHFLPDGQAVLFTAGATSGANWDDAQIVAHRLDTGEQKVLIRGGTYPHYVPTGHLLYYRAGTVMAVPFDPVRLEVQGTPAPVLEEVQASTGNTGAAQFSIAGDGTVAYVPGGGANAGESLVWVDRRGVSQPLPAPSRDYKNPIISPDGRRAAIVAAGSPGTDVWIYDLVRDTLTRLTFEGNSDTPYWTPDGKRVVFEAARGGPLNLFWKSADGSGPEERLTTGEYVHTVGSFTPDGRTLVYAETHPKTQRDLWVLPLDGERKPRLFLQTPFNESTGRLSPDGHWLAYISDESGRYEVYVRPFPGPGGKWQISTEGGNEVAWSPKGGELFYRTGNRMMAVDISTEPTLAAGKPRLLFEGLYSNTPGAGIYYSVSPDAQRFLMLKGSEAQQTSLTQINAVFHWFEELKARVPVTLR